MRLLGASVAAAVEEVSGDKIEGHLANVFAGTPDSAEQVVAAFASSF